MAVGRQPQPELMKRNAIDVGAELAELMEVAMSGVPPVTELDAQLEAGLSGANKVPFVDLQNLVEELQRRNGRLADTDRADLLGLRSS